EIVYKVTGVWQVLEPALKKAGIKYALFTGVIPNPTVDGIDEATAMGKKAGVGAVIGIGGGSAVDTGKSAAVLLHPDYVQYNARDLYLYKFDAVKAVPIIAINTTHGTGTEMDRFAVASIPELEYKPALAVDCLYPQFAIDDPAIMVGLPSGQTRYTAIDALNHVVEAATSLATNPYVVLTAMETGRLVAKYLPQALAHPDDLTARYYLLYASMIGGICFDNGLLHFTHAMEHPLSGIKPDLPHGLGLAMLLPAVIKVIYPACPEILASIFRSYVPELQGVPGEAEKCAAGVEKWLFNVGVTEKLADYGYTEKDLENATRLTFETPSLNILLSVAPVKATEEIVRKIYMDSLKPMNP
ncbi:MAG TPA: iron-containing alcohol dehydrogenase, partial [Syntrophomonadaceae bacterium]|nr:iron-containing alcohol dehydrogenase [Syntrophomonadaceae bacterium]